MSVALDGRKYILINVGYLTKQTNNNICISQVHLHTCTSITYAHMDILMWKMFETNLGGNFGYIMHKHVHVIF